LKVNGLQIGRRFARLVGAMLALAAMISAPIAQAGSDQIVVDLRVDQPAVYGAADFVTDMFATATNSSPQGSDWTPGYLGLYDAPNSGFVQVGLGTNNNSIFWFVWADPGTVTCLIPNTQIGNGCNGAYNDIAHLGAWHRVELVNYGSGWIARVYEANSGVSHDVATIAASGSRVYRVMEAGEEVFSSPTTDPGLQYGYLHNHPQYMVWGTGFQQWPASSGGNNNTLFVSKVSPRPSVCPDPYTAAINLGGDNRYWWTGLTSLLSGGVYSISCSVPALF
jgi:hypothetical protein